MLAIVKSTADAELDFVRSQSVDLNIIMTDDQYFRTHGNLGGAGYVRL